MLYPVSDHALDRLIDYQETYSGKLYERSAEGSKNATTMMILSLLISFAVAIGLSYRAIRVLKRSTANLLDVVSNVQATGDVSLRVKPGEMNELGQIGVMLNSTLDTISEIIREVKHEATEVSSIASQLSAASVQISEGSREQSEAAAATAAAVEEITVSIASVADSANQASQVASVSLTNTRAGGQSMCAMNDEIQSVQNTVNRIDVSVKDFVKRTTSIADMTKHVREIADQTNLLALNAAIEAARAGEQGRGFAVVADEVRKLAEKSSGAAREIDAVTQALSDQSAQVELVIREGLASLNAASEQVVRVSSILAESGQSVQEATEGIREISDSMSEQSKAATEIARNVERIAQMSEENFAAIAESVHSTRNLETLAQNLNRSVSRLTVD